MDLIEVSGSHYQIGFQIGVCTADKIDAVLSPKPLSPGFRKRVAALAPIHERAFPHLFAELKGMADGAELASENWRGADRRRAGHGHSDGPLGRGGFLA